MKSDRRQDCPDFETVVFYPSAEGRRNVPPPSAPGADGAQVFIFRKMRISSSLDAAFSAALMYALPLQLTIFVDAGVRRSTPGSAGPPTRQTTALRQCSPHFMVSLRAN